MTIPEGEFRSRGGVVVELRPHVGLSPEEPLVNFRRCLLGAMLRYAKELVREAGRHIYGSKEHAKVVSEFMYIRDSYIYIKETFDEGRI